LRLVRRADLRVLGHLDVLVDGVPVVVPRGLPTRLCVMLAAQAGSALRDDVLVDRLWPEPAPSSAVASLRNTVGRIRALIGPSAIVRHGDGYAFDNRVVTTDLAEFECLTTRLDGTNPAAARSLIDQALGLVRGLPLADVASEPWAVPLVSYWEEQIAGAVDRWAELAVELTDHAAVPVLRRRAHERPEREARWVRLMELLARTGRRAEALRAFREARAALAEFGIEPGPELRRAERAIVLDEAPTARTPQPEIGDAGPPFVGRHEDLAELAAAVAMHPVITVTGLGGVGKTRLARELMVGVAPQFAGGAFFVDLAPIADGNLVGTAIAATAGLRRSEPAVERDEIDQLGDVLHEEPALLVLDNAEHVADAVAGVVRRLAARAPDARFVVTSRLSLGLDVEHVFHVEPLPVPAEDDDRLAIEASPAVHLLLQLTGAPPGVGAVDAARIVGSVGGLPLGIELCARLASVLSLGEVARGLGHRQRVLGLGAGSGSSPLRAALDWVVERSDPVDVAVFRRLSAFRGPFTLRSAEHVVDRGDLTAPVVASLGHLVESSLVRAERREPTAYRLDVVQGAYAHELAAWHHESAALEARVASWYRTLALDLMAELRGGSQREAIALLDIEMDNYRELISRCLATDRGDDALVITTALSEYWFFTGFWVEGAAWIDAALSASTADVGMEHALAMVQRARVGGTYATMSDRGLQLRTAIEIAERHGRTDVAREAQAWLGLARARAGDFVGSWEDLSAVVSDAATYPWAAANARMFLGMGLAMLGQLEQGRHECHEAARSFHELGDELNAANVLKNIGLVLSRHGAHEPARDDLVAALDGAGDVMPVLTAHARYALLMIDLDAGRTTGEDVEGELYGIRSDLRRVGDLSHLSGCNRALASLHVARGDVAGALELLREPVHALVDHDEQELALVLLDIADCYLTLGRRSGVQNLAAAAKALATGTGYAWDRAQYDRLAALTGDASSPVVGDRDRTIDVGVLTALGGVDTTAPVTPITARPVAFK
jgi:predicted ATPase/DNA-binding SARP family transcriptional activator